MKKTIEYSYPSSTNAVKNGYGSTGCYCVELVDEKHKSKVVAAYPTKIEAIAHAETLPNEWHPLYLKYN